MKNKTPSIIFYEESGEVPDLTPEQIREQTERMNALFDVEVETLEDGTVFTGLTPKKT